MMFRDIQEFPLRVVGNVLIAVGGIMFYESTRYLLKMTRYIR